MRIYDIKPPIAKQLGAAKKRTKKYWLLATAFVKSSRYGIPVLSLFFLICAGGIISALTAPERKSITAFPGKVEGDWARQENIKKTDLPPDSLATGFNFKNSTFSYRIFAELNLPQETPGGSTNEIIPTPPVAEPPSGDEAVAPEGADAPALETSPDTKVESAEKNLPPAETTEPTGENIQPESEVPAATEEPAPSETPAETSPEAAPETTSPPAEAPPATELPASEPPSESVSFWYRFFGAALGQVFAQNGATEETAGTATPSTINSEADAALAKPAATPIEVDESAKTAVT